VSTTTKESNPTDEIEPLRTSKFAEPIEELIKLLSQSKRTFLIGAGCSKCAGLPLMEELTQRVLESIPSNEKTHIILQELIKQYDGGKDCTIEDYMSELVDLASLADRRKFRSAKVETVPIGKQSYTVSELQDALTEIKKAIGKIIAQCKVRIHHHRQFVRAIHDRLQSGKSGPICPADYFTLNYDTLLEDALSLQRVSVADGFNGGATGWWHADAYSDPNTYARIFKLHGSVDWCLLDDDVLPCRVRYGLKDGESREPVLIWPASTKYREAQRDPFAQIIEIMRRTLRPTQNNEVVLAIVGYSFSDLHINYELDRSLRESDGRLTILVFTNFDHPEGLLAEWLKDSTVREHVRIHANRGFFHADTHISSKVDLPWWKFEVLVRLLGGDR